MPTENSPGTFELIYHSMAIAEISDKDIEDILEVA